MLNTHTYDGQLSLLPSSLSLLLVHKNLECIPELRKSFTNPISLYYFDIIVRDGYTLPNFDPTNKMYAFDILYLLALYKDQISLLILEEQLAEMMSGFCPQGRVIRLYQVLRPIIDSDTKFKKEENEQSVQ